MAAANLLKHAIDRPRPAIAHWTTYSSSSCPSGDDADGNIIYLLLAVLALCRTDDRFV